MAEKIIKSVKFLPEFLQTGKNAKFLASTLDQLIQKPELERLDAYIGSSTSTQVKSYQSSDSYVTENSDLRANYQLTPSLIVKDEEGNVKDVVGINDLINDISLSGGNVENFDKLFRTHYHSYDLHIDTRKFEKYQEYYWLVNGPPTIDIANTVTVTTSIIGQTDYTIPTLNQPLLNGMKIRFTGNASPISYQNKVYWVEGVGSSIKLVDDAVLKVSENIADIYDDSFDQSLFDEYPFDSYKQLPLVPDYITINRSSNDLNPWTRYNRWVHKDVIEVSSSVNDVQPYYPSKLRAQRPIIEFDANIKLYNFGSNGLAPIDVVDTVTVDAFSVVEGSAGHFADGVALQQGYRIIFTAETDLTVRSKIYEVNFVTINGEQRLTLVEVESPAVGDNTYVNYGTNYGGTSWWYTGTAWKFSQQHNKLNQPPLFDLFDKDGNSYSDQDFYNSDFKGNKVFGYDLGTGPNDTVLGFPLNYRNSVGVGSYLFKNYLTAETITLSDAANASTEISSSVAYIKKDNSYANAWKSVVTNNAITKTYSAITSSEFYNLPLGLTNNPFNGPIASLTRSDIIDHISTASNETRLITSDNPLSFALMFIGKKDHNIIDAVTKAADQYNLFKLAFIKQITDLDIQTDPVRAVDEALKTINLSKNQSFPYFLSDMVAYGDNFKETVYVVDDTTVDTYPISSEYNLNDISFRSVLVYINDEQLVYGKDYEFLTNDFYVRINVGLYLNDRIVIKDYTDTKGCYIPSTPSKLGLYPKYEPMMFEDDSYVTPVDVIQGHDGSITVAFGDYRDAVILELEKRIYNNIKGQYRKDILDYQSLIPGAFRTTDFSVNDINNIVQGDFLRWISTNGVDWKTNSSYDSANSYTWNYKGGYIQPLNVLTHGSWRWLYTYLYDTDRPDLYPWRMLGFTVQPSWWEEEYGAAPYLSTNTKLWTDLRLGRIRQGSREGIDTVYARSQLASFIPVDSSGDLKDPDTFVINLTISNVQANWEFNDWGPAEAAWRKSSHWPFIVQKIMALCKPATYASLFYDPIRLTQNLSGQWIYGQDNILLDLRQMPVQGVNDYATSGYSVFVSEAGRQRSFSYNTELSEDLANADISLFYKVGGFIDKSQFQVSIDAFDPLSTAAGSVLQPEDYKLILNTSNPIRKTSISGVVVQKEDNKFLVKGLDDQSPYFTVYTPIRNQDTVTITVGGVAEKFVKWTAGNETGGAEAATTDTTSASTAPVGVFYQKGQYVQYNNNFYITTVSHRSGSNFEDQYFQRVPELPIRGGTTVQAAEIFDKNSTVIIPYGTVYNTTQEVYDLIVGYGQWLIDQGFEFNEFNNDLQSTLDWNFTAKEFLYWTTQNWQTNSVIALSPFANELTVKFTDSVVDNIFNSFYEYNILEASGLAMPQKFLNVVRDEGKCTIKCISADRGIYFARLYSVQKEHAIVFNNTTIFNDSILNLDTGYRQQRMKVSGFRTSNWNGDYFSPGFVYDTAIISDWKQYKDYKFEDVVKFNGNYYAANKNIVGTLAFNFDDWRLLGKKPVASLIPNFDYKISQFEDFYSLDISNFDEGQQKAAQHLVGYTPRVYLNNIFADPIAQYKFYQGFIKEKGTKNSITKLQRATVQTLNAKLDYNEEWAFRMGYYGSYSSRKEIEFTVQEGSFYDNPQIIEFTNTVSTVTNLRISVKSTDLLAKPLNYSTTQTFVTTDADYNDVFSVQNAGYARFDDVEFNAFNENALLAFTSTDVIKTGQTIWLANTKINDWSVLRKRLAAVKLVKVELDSLNADVLNFTTDKPHGFSAEEIVSVEQFDPLVNGIYKINSVVDRDTFSVISTTTAVTDTIESLPGLIFKFTNSRFNNFDDLPEDSVLLGFPRNAKIWVDHDDNNRWAVYQKVKNYKNYTIQSATSPVEQSLGFNINKQKDSTLLMVGNPGYVQSNFNYGNVFVYKPGVASSSLLFRYGINNVSTATYYDESLPSGFGNALFYDAAEYNESGYGLLFAGGPLASKITIPAAAIPSGSLIEQGIVKISAIAPDTLEEQVVNVIKSPNSVSYERYGSSLHVSNPLGHYKTLFVGAPYTQTLGTGTVYKHLLNSSGTVISTSTIILTSSTVQRLEIVSSGTNYKVDDLVYVSPATASKPLVARITKVNANGSVRSFSNPLDNSVIFSALPGSVLNSVSTTATNTGTGLTVNVVLSTEQGSQWGQSLAGTDRGRGVFVIGAPGFANGKGLIAIYTGTGTLISQTIQGVFENNSNFGSSISISPSGSYIFVAAPNARTSSQGYGKVAVYYRESSTQNFTLTQVISNPVPGVGMKFGQSLDISEDEEELVISALGTNRRIPLSFDDRTELDLATTEEYDNDFNSDFSLSETSYDVDSTNFLDRVAFSGSVYIYNRKNTLFRAADELSPVNINSGTNYGYSVALKNNNLFVGAPAVVNENNSSVISAFHQFYKIDQTADSWKLLRHQDDLISVDSVSKVSLINTDKDEVIDYLDVVDPLKGKVLGIADQEISYKMAYDPAVYSIGGSAVNVNLNTNWLDEHVGELWWDLSTVKYPWYEQGELEYRKNYWGTPFPGSTIDVYEWVKTTFLPSQWVNLARSQEGLSQGVSGTPKFVDNSTLAVKQVYDSNSGNFINYYYYWVKNPLIVPAAKNRRISGFQVSKLIENPKLQGERYIEILSANALAVANCSNLLVGDKVSLNVVYNSIDNPTPRHTEWLILQEGSETQGPPAALEQKMLDSLKGTDKLGNLVPDPTLSKREKYGIEIRPRQSMFKDRWAALRNLIEYVNGILIDQRITGVYSFENLNKQDPTPLEISGEFDQIVEDETDLDAIDTDGIEPAMLSCIVSNGKIVAVSIDNSGYGYRIAPTVEIENNLHNAKITTEINELGQVTAASIAYPGKAFGTAPLLTVRPYTVLVLADSTYNGKWTKYVWNNADVITWTLDKKYLYGQKVKYNNNFYSSKYYIDSNTQFDPSDWNLLTLTEVQGTWVRSKTQLYNTPLYWQYVDWISSSYDKFKEVLYVVNEATDLDSIFPDAGDYVKVKDNGLGNYLILQKITTGLGTFDANYDVVYSENGTIQLSNNLWDLTNNNLGYDANAFDQTLFAQAPDLELQYILDALKKDIFIGELKKYWNLSFFKCVRYALSEQMFLDWAFKTSFISVTNFAGTLTQIPVYKLADTKFYEDYVAEAKPYHTQIRSFTTKYNLVDNSRTYTTDFDLPPVFDEDQNAIISVTSGSSYLSQWPWKSWAQNYGSTTTIRSNIITMKYDRVSRGQDLEDLSVIDNFVGDGLKSEFILSWVAQPQDELISVFLDNNKILSSEYEILYYTSDVNGYSKKFCKLRFTEVVPEIEQLVTIEYTKSTELLTAIDRILHYYSPTAEMPGKELAQLMTGLEYSKLSVEGLSLNYNTRWSDGVVGFDDAGYEDEIDSYTFTTSTAVSTTVSSTLTALVLHSVSGIVAGQTVNVISSTGTYFVTTGVYDEPRVYSVTTATKTINVNKIVNGTIPAGSKIEFWSYNQNPSGIDTQYIGGDFSYVVSTATGAIELNGAGFITPDSSYGPEELIPGEMHESIGINVYTKAPIQAPVIVASYIDIITAYTTVTRELTVVPPNAAAVMVTYDNSVVTATIVTTAAALTSTLYLSTTTGFQVGNSIYPMGGLQDGTSIIGLTGTNGIIISNPVVSTISSGTVIQVLKPNTPCIFDYVTYTGTYTSFTAANQFTIDWQNESGLMPLLIVAPQPYIGKLAYTVIDMGGGSTTNQTGFIDKETVIVEGVTMAELESASTIDTVKSAYVTVNGVSIASTSTSTAYYTLTYANELNRRAVVKIYNLATSTTVLSSWFFGTEQQLWNEISEEIKTVTPYVATFSAVATASNFTLTNVSSVAGITAGVTTIYFRNNVGDILENRFYGVVSTTTSTITLNTSVSFPSYYPTTTIVEGKIVISGYQEIIFADAPVTGTVEPQLANSIIEFKNDFSGSRRQLIPPQINYYSVDNPSNNSFAITNKRSNGTKNPLNINEIRVYLNGSELRRGFDYILYTVSNIVKIDTALLSVGDVVAILNKPGSASGGGEQDYEYDVYNQKLLLCASAAQQRRNPYATSFTVATEGWNVEWKGEIKTITYNTHDNLFMRTETFDGNSSGRFKISRPILNESYVWVALNGVPLANYYDFEVLDDGMTVQLTNTYNLTPGDLITIRSFASNKTTEDILGYRIFNDIFNRYNYKRLSKDSTTELTAAFTEVDSYIYVEDASVLTRPIVESNIPGAVMISGERIEFFKIYSLANEIEIVDAGNAFESGDTITFSGGNWIVPLVATVTANGSGAIVSLTFEGGIYNGNAAPLLSTFNTTSGVGTSATFAISVVANSVLAQLRRATLGTAPKVYNQIGTKVIDQGTAQTVPFTDRILRQSLLTEESIETYTISTASNYYYVNTATNSTATWMNNGIILSNLVNPSNQIEVYYGGRRLEKSYRFVQDPAVAYDNQSLRIVDGVTLINTTATTLGLPSVTTVLGTTYVVTATNQVWVYEKSLEENAISGYVYRGLMRKDPEFTLNTATQQITLNIEGGVAEGVRLTVVKKEFSAAKLWNNGESLLDSDSNPAKFLKAKPAELPDAYYYGGNFEIYDGTGEALTDDDGNPIIGLS